ncbi:hypothetical protein N183_35010 [Sinorhizobium sp. Sb3]|uniref:hypothetical protein n=1 Tax=Sinorhizobium sp. Sb3 TaxID=1358417 RepID=UPI000726DE0F|nr:hypothetical protein [Sinorhizobium sp. Sb3]KSV64578.1 hypothetical protein N183_35010 [Sinorhizobium sp. Sb3]
MSIDGKRMSPNASVQRLNRVERAPPIELEDIEFCQDDDEEEIAAWERATRIHEAKRER